ncbi:MAG: hypothetical protein AAFV85_26950 [Cyanobacteria bacterium J06634_6]
MMNVSPQTSRGLARLGGGPLAHILNEVRSDLWANFQKAALEQDSLEIEEFEWLVTANILSNDIQKELQDDDEDLILQQLFDRSPDAARIWEAINEATYSELYKEVLEANADKFED